MHRSLPKLTRALAAVAGVVALASCGSDNGPNSGTVKDYFSAVQAVVNAGPTAPAPASAFSPSVGAKSKGLRPSFNSAATTINGTYHSGTAPTGSGGPTASGEAGSTPLLGQPFRFSLVGSAAFTKVYIWVDGVDGYWELDLPVSVQTVELVLQMTANAPASFNMRSALGTSGANGPAFSTAIQTVDLSNADVVATVKWTGASDVDLHVIDGKGQEVYYANPTTAEGGHLDLDSNAGCAIDNVNQETISWAQGKAPTGPYTVKVDYYDDCGVASSPYTGTVSVKGNVVKNFSGTFTGAAGVNNPEATVYQFTF